MKGVPFHPLKGWENEAGQEKSYRSENTAAAWGGGS